MPRPDRSGPDWERLFETAAGQAGYFTTKQTAEAGYFTTKQAAEAGYSTNLLRKHVIVGRVARLVRGLYRLIYFSASEHEGLVTAWLWSEQIGVVSHQTALALHGLADVLPANVYLTLPTGWRRRRLRVPSGVVLHHADLEFGDRAWFGVVLTTSPRRTLSDCANGGPSPELLLQAAQQALRRGLVGPNDVNDVERALAAF